MIRFTPEFLETLRSRISLSSVIGGAVKLTRRGHEWTGLCPFHKEKTGSFTVSDDKGFYHCFGCGAHGDIIGWMMNYERLTYPEAVKTLAQRAGLSLPADKSPTPADKNAKGMLAALETACQFFEKTLFAPTGEVARAYLQKRQMPVAAAKKFRLGFAPGQNQLCAFLKAQGFDLAVCAKAGLCVFDEGKKVYRDYFFNRLMFPILSKSGKVIAFGGRLLHAGEPKYLNSPETPLFHKGENLYGLFQSLSALYQKCPVILVEGYMDVITLHTAGFCGAVAPLGTALTPEQLGVLWKYQDEPVICFDGDGAGQKAAIRALGRALPILAPGKSLNFLRSPDNLDPDDIIHQKGGAFFEQLLNTKMPLIDLLWDHFYHATPLTTPERFALFEQNILGTLNGIKNASVKELYTKEIQRRLWNDKRAKKFPMHTGPKIVIKPTMFYDAKMLLGYLCLYPVAVMQYMETLSSLTTGDKTLHASIQKILTLVINNPDITAADLQEQSGLNLPLKEIIFMIQKSDLTEAEVLTRVGVLLESVRHHELQLKINTLKKQYTKTHDKNTLDEITGLMQMLG